MSLLRPIAPVDVLFLGSVAALAAATLASCFDQSTVERRIGTAAWVSFTCFWAVTATEYLLTSRTFLGVIGLVTVGVSAYTTTIVHREHDVGTRLTMAFTVMALLFVPFEFLDPVHSAVLSAVAAHTALGLQLVGFDPIIGYGSGGYANVIYFQELSPKYGVKIISACSGISAIALFVGLITATRARVDNRLRYAVAVGLLVYGLNVFRAVLVAGSIAGTWFGFATGVIASTYGVADPRLASYYVAEYLLSQVLIVVVLLYVYVRLSDALPELQYLVGGVVAAAESDWSRLR